VEYPLLEALKENVAETLSEYGVTWSTGSDPTVPLHWVVRVPRNLPVPSLHQAIQARIALIDARVQWARGDPVSGNVKMEIGRRDSVLFVIDLIAGGAGERNEGLIALIIDDFGDRWNSFIERFFELGADITVSVIPGQKMSREVARRVMERRFELILHLPMEPLDQSIRSDDFMIMQGMSGRRIRDILQRSLDGVPGVLGINNHMGSRTTSDQETMERFLAEVKALNLFFVDSRTTASSLGYTLAQTMGVPSIQRDVFIDVNNDEESIRRSLWELARLSGTRGYAVGIGHCRRKTLAVLEEEVSKIQARGYRFVPVSRLVH